MFTPNNNIIIVDNQREHLERLSKVFRNKGIGCRELEYDSFYDEPLTGIRLAFFDINLDDLGGNNDAQIFNVLSNAINIYVHPDNGPYALIFWTSNSGLVDRFKAYVQRRKRDLVRPFLVSFIDKDEFLDNEADLESKLQEIIGTGVVKLLMDFQKIASLSAMDTVNQIFSIIPSNDNWGNSTDFILNFDKVFSDVATRTFGFDHAKENPDRAIYEALIPLINYQMLKRSNQQWGDALSVLRNAQNLDGITSPPGFKRSLLNTIFHIENEQPLKNVRGCVVRLDKRRKMFNCSFLEFVNRVVPYNKHENFLVEMNKSISQSVLIGIELSSSCDYQQNKNRLNKYLCGIIIPKRKAPKLIHSKYAEYILQVGTFTWKNSEVEIWVNLNYLFGAVMEDRKLGNSLFLLKKEIMDMIGNKYANHVSRIGITSF